MNIYDIINRARSLKEEYRLDSVTPERLGALHEDTLKYINEYQLLASSPAIHKTFPSISAMQSSSSPKSDLTGKPLKAGQLVVIVPADPSDSTAGDVYRYDGPSGNTSKWTFVAKIGAVPADAELSATSTNPPQNQAVTAKLTELESETDEKINIEHNFIFDLLKKIEKIQSLMPNVEDKGFKIIDEQGNVALSLNEDGFDVALLSEHLISLIRNIGMDLSVLNSLGIYLVEEDGFFIADADGNIGFRFKKELDAIVSDTFKDNVYPNSDKKSLDNIHIYGSQYVAIEKLRKDAARMLNSVSTIKDEGVDAISKTITIPMASANEDVSHAVIRIGLHRGNKIGTDTRYDVFFDGKCKKDFSDIRIKDSNGNVLPACFLHSGNYEVVRDDRLGSSVIAMDKDGNLYHVAADGYIYKTSDDFKTMQKLSNQSFYTINDTLFIDSRGGMWVNSNAKVYVCYPTNGEYDFANAIEVLDYSVSNGEVNQGPNFKVTENGIIEDSAGFIYVGQYQVNPNPVIFRSIYPLGADGVIADGNGKYFKEVYTQIIVKNEDGTINHDMTDQHIHHLHAFVAKDAQGRDVDNIIAGLDSGSSRGANLISSIDHGETWVSFRDTGILKDNKEWIQQFAKDYSMTDISADRTFAFCHGEGDILGGMTTWKLYTDVDSEGRIVPIALAYPVNTGQGTRSDNMADEDFILNAFLPSTQSCDSYNLVVTEDKGKTWKSIYNEYHRRTIEGAGDGARWIKRFDRLANGADEMCWYATGQNTDANNYGALRIYKGGNHYYGEVLVYVGHLKRGKDITLTIENGYSYVQPSAEILDKNVVAPIWELPLNECVGNRVQDSNGIWHDIKGKHEWDRIESTKRFYQYYPMLKDNAMVGGLKLSIGSYIELGKVPQLKFNKGFSVLIWLATGDYDGTLLPNKEYSDVYFPVINSQDFNVGLFYWYGAYAGGKRGGTFASANIQSAINKANVKLYKPFLYTFSDDAIPVVKCYVSDRDCHTFKSASSWNVPMLNTIELKIGSERTKHSVSNDLNKNYYIGSIAFYDKELTAYEVRSILNGRGITSEYNDLFHN